MSNWHRFSCDEVVALLHAKQQGDGWLACCPAHNDKTPSLSIKQKDNSRDVILHCFAGCDFLDILRSLSAYSPLPFTSDFQNRTIKRPTIDHATKEADERNAFYARQIVQASRPLDAVEPVLRYLKNRGIESVNSSALRAHRNLKYSPGGSYYPALIASVSDMRGNLLGVHRTYVSYDGLSKAPVDKPKKMLGNLQDGSVQLAEPGSTLMIGEGIETCLSAMQATGLPAWAALSASRLPLVSIPECVTELIILADHDDAGKSAAALTGRRWVSKGKRVRIALPPAPGGDFNDLLRGEG